MQTNDANNIQQRKSGTPVHSPVVDTDDAALKSKVGNDEQKLTGTSSDQPQRISREAAEKGIAPDADPDDPVSP